MVGDSIMVVHRSLDVPEHHPITVVGDFVTILVMNTLFGVIHDCQAIWPSNATANDRRDMGKCWGLLHDHMGVSQSRIGLNNSGSGEELYDFTCHGDFEFSSECMMDFDLLTSFCPKLEEYLKHIVNFIAAAALKIQTCIVDICIRSVSSYIENNYTFVLPSDNLNEVRLRQLNKRFNVSSAKFNAAETYLALEYLHMMGIVYKDHMPENVLVRKDEHIMLSDFDLSLKCVSRCKTSKNRRKISHIPSCTSPIQ
ncbi:hypothetical protein Sjap_015263 [Stephania japonica]|uniref:non-specific serine/threonine protein kinase n=1 Tax=Stephania japonica TaxID=461633 RepID=A0AAP0IIS4_9MAGN